MLIKRSVAAPAGAMALIMAIAASPAVAQKSNWDEIKNAGVLKVGVMPGRQPYMWQKDGKWEGFAIEMARGVARALENANAMNRPIKVEWKETTWGTVVLDIQSGKLDAFFGMSITDKRKKAIDMYGPLYALAHVYINTSGFNPGDRWEDYNKAAIKVSATTGTTDEAAARKLSPSATILSMRTNSETILAVQSGRAEAMITSVLAGLDAMHKNRNFSKMVIPKPMVSLPSGGGARKDSDGRFTTFMQGWAHMSRESGYTKKLILESVAKAGLNPDNIPPEMEF